MNSVYLIHGWAYNLDRYQKLIAALKSRGVNVKVLKVPGLTAPSSEIWTIDTYVNWLREELKSTPKPVVIGHSNGGRIGLAFAQSNPGRLAKLILIDSAGIPNNTLTKKLKLAILRYLAKVAKLLGEMPKLKKIFYRLIGAGDYFKAPPNMKITMQNMLAADRSINVSNIKVPALIIWGREDTATPLADGQKLSEALDAPLKIIDNARHSPHDSHPDKVADIICEAIGKTT